MISNERFLKELDDELYEQTGIHDCCAKYCGMLTIEDIFTTGSVYMAACHAANGFRDKNDTAAFMAHAWLNSKALADKVVSGKFRPSYYSERNILERGKPRVIKPPTFESKVVQKLICDWILRPILEPKMISGNYASVKGRGTEALYAGVLRSLNRNVPGCMIVTVDFSGYFASIDNNKLAETLSGYIKDDRITNLFRTFGPKDFGLSLGNETSQVPASFFPSPIDHMLKDQFGCKDVHRYMDDLLFIGKPEQSERYLEAVYEKAGVLNLSINYGKTRMIPWGRDFIFCKERFFFNPKTGKYYRHINPHIISTERRKLKAFRRGRTAPEIINAQFKGVIGVIRSHPNTYHERQKLQADFSNTWACADG